MHLLHEEMKLLYFDIDLIVMENEILLIKLP